MKELELSRGLSLTVSVPRTINTARADQQAVQSAIRPIKNYSKGSKCSLVMYVD